MRSVWLVGLIAVSQVLLGCTAAEPRQPNVLIILTDDQGTLDANCYGATDLYTPSRCLVGARSVSEWPE